MNIYLHNNKHWAGAGIILKSIQIIITQLNMDLLFGLLRNILQVIIKTSLYGINWVLGVKS